MTLVFDRISETYDNWYDSTEGRTIFELEVECLRSICANFRGNWLEVGVGTGRFAARLGVSLGLDLSLPMLAVAGTRGLKVCAGAAERLPFPESSMDGVLMALVLCFLKDPVLALKECARVLRPRGSLLLGFIPASSPWGRWYERKKAELHPVYSLAFFYTDGEVLAMAEHAGFVHAASAGTLFGDPKDKPVAELRVQSGFYPDAGFAGLLFVKTQERRERRP